MTPADVESTLRRPARFWSIDGLPLIGIDAVWLFWGGFSLVLEELALHPSDAGRLAAQYVWVLVNIPQLCRGDTYLTAVGAPSHFEMNGALFVGRTLARVALLKKLGAECERPLSIPVMLQKGLPYA